ncbi:type IV secretory system conjugative DNA transfer family protein, partial [Aeromicrobium sp. CF4.19]|uniref:type IV secretory system conjugative DNA transfer family protein n=1 Tax=Aeromicrobium sp. CF4.19 TaxID=3373082 RepID=UPI003EE7A8D7
TSKVEGTGSSNQKFWDDNAKRTLAPLLFAAAQTPRVDTDTGKTSHERHIAQVGRWLQRGAVSDPEVEAILHATGDRDAIDAFAGVRSAHEQTRQNIGSTAQLVLDPFAHPRTRTALTPTNRVDDDFDPARVLDEGGTLYVFAPEHEAEEFKPLFETIINTLVFAAEDRSARSGGVPIEPHHLLLALDEAANMASLRKMPELASVGSSQGIVLLSVWQNTSQIETIYGSARSRTLLAGHNGKVFWGGIQDEETLKYVEGLAGEFEFRKVTQSQDQRGRSSNVSYETKALAPKHFVRNLPDGEVLVLFRNVKPMRLRVTPWFKDDGVRALVDPSVAAEFDSAFGGASPPPRIVGRVHRMAGEPHE